MIDLLYTILILVRSV